MKAVAFLSCYADKVTSQQRDMALVLCIVIFTLDIPYLTGETRSKNVLLYKVKTTRAEDLVDEKMRNLLKFRFNVTNVKFLINGYI